MQITINQTDFDLPEDSTVEQAVAKFGASPPFAVALNLGFVHRQDYPTTRLQSGDCLEIVQPVAGG